MSHDPVAYTYEAAEHCPSCALARFGRCTLHGQIGGCYATCSAMPPVVDREGNPIGAIFPWDLGEYPEGIVCGTCRGEIEPPYREPEPLDD